MYRLINATLNRDIRAPGRNRNCHHHDVHTDLLSHAVILIITPAATRTDGECMRQIFTNVECYEERRGCL